MKESRFRLELGRRARRRDRGKVLACSLSTEARAWSNDFFSASGIPGRVLRLVSRDEKDLGSGEKQDLHSFGCWTKVCLDT